MRRVPFTNFPAQFEEEREALLDLTEQVFNKGLFVGGPEVDAFETAVAAYCETSYAVAVASGTDALILGLKVLGIEPGDEVITPVNSFVSSAAAIVAVGAVPVFADVLDDQNIDPASVEAAVTDLTRAVMPVHLTGRIADMDSIMDIAARHGLDVIEDAAQAIGSRFRGRRAGTFGRAGCFSAHPLKNLNAAGDAGFVITDEAALAERIGRLRNNGHVDRNTVAEWGVVSRLDSLQAGILSMRLARLDRVIEKRRANVARYRKRFDPMHVFMPKERNEEFNTFHTCVVQVEGRDELQRYLAKQGVDTAIHYPVPIHMQPAAAGLGYKKGDFPRAEAQADRILSIPVHQFLEPEDIEYVADTINGFFQ